MSLLNSPYTYYRSRGRASHQAKLTHCSKGTWVLDHNTIVFNPITQAQMPSGHGKKGAPFFGWLTLKGHPSQKKEKGAAPDNWARCRGSGHWAEARLAAEFGAHAKGDHEKLLRARALPRDGSIQRARHSPEDKSSNMSRTSNV